jgi:N-acylneuraminate cytidylyltransferase
MANIAIIPARGGSKRIPGKNIKDFLGDPILSYSIKAAIKSKLFAEVMVSTDDARIADIARSNGANVPFLRSRSNANDHAVLAAVIEEVLLKYQEIGENFKNACCILPTAPFVTAASITNGHSELIENNFDCVFPVLPFSFPIQRSLKFKDKKVEMVWNEFLNTRSQDIEPRYHDAGQFYWLNIKTFLKKKKFFTSNSGGIIISELYAQDIDTETDWKLAEMKYKLMLNEEENTF